TQTIRSQILGRCVPHTSKDPSGTSRGVRAYNNAGPSNFATHADNEIADPRPMRSSGPRESHSRSSSVTVAALLLLQDGQHISFDHLLNQRVKADLVLPAEL